MLYGPKGEPLLHKKAKAPHLGPAYGDWADRDNVLNQMPGAAVLQFDLSRLTYADLRAMRYHPQINASLALLTFMIHGVEWRIECADKKIQQKVEENVRDIWTRLVRGLSQAFWAGFSPNVLEYENNSQDDGLPIVVSKVKDLFPEDCSVHWKTVEGAIPPGSAATIPPKLKVYDGIDQWGAPGPIPPDHTLWYPLLMENGDYTGRKLLKACFTPWYFSTLIHLFANRYYERFGEPTPIGRAPFDEEIEQEGGGTISGKAAMEMILRNLRNRGTVTLPSDRDPVTKEFDYMIEYLESQMRGADFERYLSRLDEEMSLGLFTPLLMLKTGDVGSNNLGVQHTQTWLWMCNAVVGDMAEYITRYVTERLKAINYTPKAPICRWVPRPMGKESVETLRAVAVELIRSNKARPDLDELGQAMGLTLREVREVTKPDPAAPDPLNPGQQTQQVDGVQRDARQRTERVRSGAPRGVGEARATGRSILNRAQQQIEKAFREGTFAEGFMPALGHERRFQSSLEAEGFTAEEARTLTESFYASLNSWLQMNISFGAEEFGTASDFVALFGRKIDTLIEQVTDGK